MVKQYRINRQCALDGSTDLLHPKIESKSFDLNHIPLLDTAGAIKLMGGNEVLVAQMLATLVKTSLPDDIALLHHAYAKKNWEDISALAHKIHGGAIYCGTTRLSHACSGCEGLSDASLQDTQRDKLYSQLIRVADETCRAVHAWLAKR